MSRAAWPPAPGNEVTGQQLLLLALAAIAAYSLLAKWLSTRWITLPMFFAMAGLIGAWVTPSPFDSAVTDHAIQVLAEITLILVLFGDAARIDVRSLRSNASIPIRMLAVGMPLALLLGTGVVLLISPETPWQLAFLTAAILTPTDASLGQAVVTSESVPTNLKQAINVESGLNDGLAVPVFLIAAALSAEAMGAVAQPESVGLVAFTLRQVLLGPLVGVAVGWVFSRLLSVAMTRDLTSATYPGILFMAAAGCCYLLAELVGGNGFIAAFAGGLTFRTRLTCSTEFIHEFMEAEGQVFTMLTFLVFGAFLIPIVMEHFGWETLALAMAFLTFVRMIPIYLSLAGTGLNLYAKTFLAWFGPRGLASILFALLVLEGNETSEAKALLACVVLAVTLSIVLHGLSSQPMARHFSDNTLNPPDTHASSV